ncbi:hypothetical protein ABIE66_002065 [Peribacillus sp. B2I2]|uniref:hypothetical protein n=1 Tax=Peribacillus sp. B2I2 TaxID=3156468 RepID=UPI00351147F4
MSRFLRFSVVRFGGSSRNWYRKEPTECRRSIIQVVVISSFNAEATRTECKEAVFSLLYSL